ncbi:MAG: phospholipase D-like domain-containing protein [Nocardioidaceae bacterium]
MTLLLMGGLLTIPVAASNAAAIAPAPGPLANNPMTKKNKRVVIRKINNAIDAAVPGSDIYIASWNMRNWGAVNKLLRAQKRGVRVLLIMAKENSSTGRQKGKRMTNKYFTRLSRGLAKGNRFVAPERRSGTKLCAHSCRGTTGIAHTKFYLFSQAGAATNVVMYGSANLTDLAATNQWNDIFTVVRQSPRCIPSWSTPSTRCGPMCLSRRLTCLAPSRTCSSSTAQCVGRVRQTTWCSKTSTRCSALGPRQVEAMAAARPGFGLR